MWMPSIRARRAAGRSAASWNSAAERTCAGAEAELAEPFGELEGADGAAGLSAGEQPGRGALVADGCVSVAGGGELKGQGVQRLGEDDGLAAEPEAYLAVADLDVAEGEPG